MAEVIPQINIDGTKIKNTWTEKEYVTDEVYNALNKAVIDLKNNNNLLDSNSILFREEYNSSSKNLNNAIHQGVYSFTSSAVNAPSGVTGGNLLVTNTSKTNQGSSIITQVAFCHNGAVYARTKNTSEKFTAWNKLAYITDNVARATADKNGNDITTGYMARVNGSISGTKDLNTFYKEGSWAYGSDYANSPNGGRGKLLLLNNYTGNNDNGTWIYQLAFPTTGSVNFYFRRNIINSGWTPWRAVAFTDSPAFSGSPTAPTPSTSDNSTKIATTGFVHNYAPSKTGSGASGTWAITANKATQDSAGQTINTTYVKGVSASNATLTVTKGNGSTSNVTVNNVSRAEYSDRVGANAGYSNDTKGSALKGGLSQSAIYNNNFPFSYGNLISVKNGGANQIALEWSGTTGAVGRVAVRSARDAGIDTWSAWRYLAYTESPAFSGTPTAPTPASGTNNKQIATTAFVQALISALTNTVNTKSDVYIGAGTGSVTNTSFTIPLPSGYSRGQCKYAIFPTSHTLDTNNSGWYTLNVNQGTGVVRGAISYDKTGGGEGYNNVSFGYVVIAVK